MKYTIFSRTVRTSTFSALAGTFHVTTDMAMQALTRFIRPNSIIDAEIGQRFLFLETDTETIAVHAQRDERIEFDMVKDLVARLVALSSGSEPLAIAS